MDDKHIESGLNGYGPPRTANVCQERALCKHWGHTRKYGAYYVEMRLTGPKEIWESVKTLKLETFR